MEDSQKKLKSIIIDALKETFTKETVKAILSEEDPNALVLSEATLEDGTIVKYESLGEGVEIFKIVESEEEGVEPTQEVLADGEYVIEGKKITVKEGKIETIVEEVPVDAEELKAEIAKQEVKFSEEKSALEVKFSEEKSVLEVKFGEEKSALELKLSESVSNIAELEAKIVILSAEPGDEPVKKVDVKTPVVLSESERAKELFRKQIALSKSSKK